MKILMSAVIAIAINFIISESAYAHKGSEKSRPMSEMQGDCGNFKMNLDRELKIWEDSSLSVMPSVDLQMEKKLTLNLSPQEKVKYLVSPQKRFPVKGNAFGEVFHFQTPSDGKFKISAGAKVWFDVISVENGTPIESAEFEMQPRCEKVFKVVSFNLKKDTRYALQINGSNKESVQFLISKD